ncbi:hypothetical protein [Caulobacter sp. 17J80-11]|uniref:hypothetical protein n=1 Tax=Caulobacter sp. 17J80-11 TaxID=2763502 RepID=UPI00165391B6|nr:hypothetical protein [Caulobacter sp. 17J80-11]MBC6980593.1 hypothetical protein [Caulobacter sp. 17J80-11]
MADTYDYDDQDQSEVFDEDNTEIDPNAVGGAEFKTFEEMPDVYDATQAVGDARDVDELDEADFSEDAVDDEDLEEEDEVVDDDVYDETDEEDVVDLDDVDGVDEADPNDVELEFTPDVDGRHGAQASAAHFESRGELDTEALEDLGYAPDQPDEEEE